MLTKLNFFALPKALTAIIFFKWGFKNLDSHYFFRMAVSRTLTAIVFFKWWFQEP